MIQDLLFAIDEYARLNITKRELYQILGKYPDFIIKCGQGFTLQKSCVRVW